jgi:hypothetical protein
MIAARYTRLFVIPLAMLLLGFAALGAPLPFRGPLLFSGQVAPLPTLGLLFFKQALYLSDVIGILLLVVATLEVWVIALAWEYRRRACR